MESTETTRKKPKLKLIGQNHLKKQLDIFFKIFAESNGEIRNHFILTGPSGNGKTKLVEYFTEKYNLPVVDVNGASITVEGISGNSVSKAIAGLKHHQSRPVVCFVDEFDKTYISSDGSCEQMHESKRGVQNEWLKVLEGKTTQVFGDYGKFDTIKTDKVLFVFAGAFNNETGINVRRLSELGVKREFLGRVPHVFEIFRLTLSELHKIAEQDQSLENWLMYCIDEEERELVKNDCLTQVKAYLSANYEDNVIGARIIPSLIAKYFVNDRKLPLEDTAGTMPQPSVLEKKTSLTSDEVEDDDF